MTTEHMACPIDGCGSSDAYTEYDDGHGWCFSCNRGVFPDKVEIGDCERVFYDGFRGIPEKVCKKLGVYTHVNEHGNPVFREYVYPTGQKFRRIHDKSFWVKGEMPALGGMELWNAGSSHYVTVVEGEEDGAAAYHMLNDGKKVPEPVVWLTSASIPGNKRKEIYKYLRQFTTVKLAIEDDKAGKEAKEILCQMLPNRIREVSLTKHKDSNDYLIHGDTKEFKQAWGNAKIYTPDNIFHTEGDVLEILMDNVAEAYFPTPFDSLNEKIRGIPLNHVTLLTGMEGIGKTEILRSLEVCAMENDFKIGVLHQEETKNTLYKGIASYGLGKSARDPDNPVPVDELMEALAKQTDNFERLFVFEFKIEPDVDAILEQINYLVHVCGCDYVFIDPINQFEPIDDTPHVKFLDSLSKKVEKYVTLNPVGVVWTAHVNDDGRTRDSRMIAKACSIRIDLSRDVESANEVERNTTNLMVSKNRPFSITGPAGNLVFDVGSFTVGEGLSVQAEEDGLKPLPF